MSRNTTLTPTHTSTRSVAKRLISTLTVAILAATGAVLGASPAYAANGSISGFATTADTDTGLAGVYVILETGTGGWLGISTSTDINGKYEFVNVPVGQYTVWFATPDDSGYGSVFYPSAPFLLGATIIDVASGADISANAVLPKAGKLSGHLTFSGAPCFTDAVVAAWDSSSSTWVTTNAAAPDVSGNWSMGNVLPGSYRLEFLGCSGSPSYTGEWYNNMRNFNDGEFITVTAGSVRTHLDALLDEDGPSNVARLAGADRFATSARIANEFRAADVVFVANGLGYPDALSAAPAAAHLNAPLLLTQKDILPANVKAQIVRLHPTTIYVVGGTGVISDAVFHQLDALAPGNTHRLAGSDRYATSQKVFTEIWNGESSSWVFLADGRNFPDALSSAAAAAAVNGPVVLVNGGSPTLPPEFGALFQTFNTTIVVLAGGTSVLSSGIETDINDLPGVITAARYSGTDRYQTSIAINGRFFGHASDPVSLAVGTGYADALAGAALAGLQTGPLYLVPGNCVPQLVLDDIADLTTSRILLFGGTGVLSPAVASLTPCVPTS